MAESQTQTTDVCEETSADDGTKSLPKSSEKEAKIPPTEDSELDEILNSELNGACSSLRSCLLAF